MSYLVTALVVLIILILNMQKSRFTEPRRIQNADTLNVRQIVVCFFQLSAFFLSALT